MKSRLRIARAFSSAIAAHLRHTDTTNNGNVVTIEKRGGHQTLDNLAIEVKKQEGYTNPFLKNKQKSKRKKR